jgi:HEPN domain-containing protein
LRPPIHDAVCFHCQQAAEKYLKSLLEECSLPIPKVHDLVRLLALVQPHYANLLTLRRGLAMLNDFAVDARYPDCWLTKRNAQSALRWAGRVRDACRALLGLPRGKSSAAP